MHDAQHKRIAKLFLPRFEPTWTGQGQAPTTSIAAVPPAQFTTEPPVATALPTTQVLPQPTTTTTSTTTTTPAAAPTTSSTTAPASVATTSTSSQSSSSTSSTSLTSSSSSSSSVVQTPVVQQTPPASTTPQVTPTTRRVVATTNSAGVLITSYVTPTITESATATATATPSSNAGTVVGAVAGAFVGVICLIAFVSWIVRQHHKRNSHDDFDRQSYLRNSMMIPDEPTRPVIGTQAALALARNNTIGPRPPTMIERKPTFYPNGQPSPSFQPGQVVAFEPHAASSVDGAYPSPVAFASYTPPAQHHQSELARRPSGARLLTRQPTNGGMYDAYGHGPDAYHAQSPGTIDGFVYPMPPADRTMIQSVTPFQAQQYAEITRQLEGPAFDHQDSFLPPISPVRHHEPVPSPASPNKSLPNPFEPVPGSPVPERLSRTGTPIDPNPQHAHWSYDDKAQGPNRLSIHGMPLPAAATPAMPPAARTRDERTVVVGNGEAVHANRPVSMVDTDDAYGGM